MTVTGGGGRLTIPAEGRVDLVPLPVVIQGLAEERKTGILTMQGDGDIVAVSLLEGAVVAADALNQTVEEGLGRVLVARGLIDQETFEGLVDEHQGGRDGNLSDVLVEQNLISRSQLLDCLRQQTLDQLFGILEWKTGEFKFYGGDEVSYEEGMAPIPVDELLVESIAASGATVPRTEAIYRAQQPSESVRIVGQDTPSGEGGIWVALEEHALWQQVDGERPAREVMPSMRPRRLQFALHRLDELGLLEPVSAIGNETLSEVGTIFMPPDPGVTDDTVAGSIRDPRTLGGFDLRRYTPWIARLAAVVGVCALTLAASRRPASLLLGFPWQESNRGGIENRLRQSRMDAVEDAARTYFLMEQRFPGSLVDLVDGGLLTAHDLRDPTGIPMGYTTVEGESGFRISVVPQGEKIDRVVEVDTEDFLLGDIRGVIENQRSAPLYLID